MKVPPGGGKVDTAPPIGKYMHDVLSRAAPAALLTAEVASMSGIHRDTLLRWLRQKEVPEPERDRHGWRLFTEAEAQHVVRYARGLTVETVAEPTPAYGDAAGLERLAHLDWNFADAKTSYLTHSLHPYPAKFIPQIPNALIQELSSVGETVADIFCGSGTTLGRGSPAKAPCRRHRCKPVGLPDI